MFAREDRQGNHVRLGHAPQRHRVDLDRREADRPGRGDSLDHLLKSRPAGQSLEPLRVHGVEADVDPTQARVPQRLSLRREQDAVGREPDVADTGYPDQPAHQLGQVAPDQRLAPREPDLVDPQARRDPREPLDLLERQQARPRQEGHALGHAVNATDIAAVGHADPQVVVDPAERVDQGEGLIAGRHGHERVVYRELACVLIDRVPF